LHGVTRRGGNLCVSGAGGLDRGGYLCGSFEGFGVRK
jgi:hypothetical protein